jgi:hypothetical protein
LGLCRFGRKFLTLAIQIGGLELLAIRTQRAYHWRGHTAMSLRLLPALHFVANLLVLRGSGGNLRTSAIQIVGHELLAIGTQWAFHRWVRAATLLDSTSSLALLARLHSFLGILIDVLALAPLSSGVEIVVRVCAEVAHEVLGGHHLLLLLATPCPSLMSSAADDIQRATSVWTTRIVPLSGIAEPTALPSMWFVST